MTAYFVGEEDQALAVETWLADHIANVIDGPLVVRNGVEQAAFVGAKLVSPAGAEMDIGDSVDTRNSERSSLLPATLGGGIAVGLMLGLVTTLFLLRRRRRNASERSEVIPEIPLDEKVVAKPADATQTETDQPDNDIENQPTSLSRNTYPDQELPSVDNVAQFVTVPTAPTSSETVDGSASTPPHDLTEETTILRQSSTDAATPSTDATTTFVDQQLPSEINIKPREDPSSPGSTKPPIPMVPKPPPPPSPPSTISSASKPPPAPKRTPTPPPGTLKKSRRKKKKKKKKLKKASVVRVNSRENINEMETITEAQEDDESNDDDDEYSWYSASDSNCSSREPSPTRSLSRSVEDEEEEEHDDDENNNNANNGQEEETDQEQPSNPAASVAAASQVPSISATADETAAAAASSLIPAEEEETPQQQTPPTQQHTETSANTRTLPIVETVTDDSSDDDAEEERAIHRTDSTELTREEIDAEILHVFGHDMSGAAANNHLLHGYGEDGASIATGASRATNDDTEGSNEPPIPSHWV